MADSRRQSLDPSTIFPSTDGTTSPLSYTSIEGGWTSVHLEMTNEALKRLQAAAETSGDFLNESIGKAFLLYLAAVEAHRDGKKVGIVGSDGMLETEFVGF
jgi:hypothetical protein